MTRDEAIDTMARCIRESNAAMAVIKATNPLRPLGVTESEAKRSESGTGAGVSPENGVDCESAPAPLACGRYGPVRPTDEPYVEGEYHKCGLEAGHEGRCRCHCNADFSPWAEAGIR